MAEFPFQLSIRRDLSGQKEESLTCRSVLRVIPGRRAVYDASWNSRAVIVKVFSHKVWAKRHLNREWRGLTLLQKHGISCPQPLFYGRTENGHWALVTAKASDSSTLSDVFKRTAEPAKRLELLTMLTKELANQHDKAVLQKDFHSGNFLLQDNKIITLDPAQIQFLSRPVSRRKGISQLAVLGCSA